MNFPKGAKPNMKKLREIGEVFKSLKHKGASKKYCPRCGSPELRFVTGFGFGFVPQKFICKSCGYVGPIIMELEKEESQQSSSSNDIV
jgi:hypothetical protein